METTPMKFHALLIMLAMCAAWGPSRSAAGSAGTPTQPTTLSHARAQAAARAAKGAAALEKATFAGGCFWSEESAFEGLPGVVSVISGYTGGTKKDPTYEEVSGGGTGHAESVEITFDPARTSYARLLDIYWHNIDPTQSDGQFCDHGDQYRPVIFYHDSTQLKLALASRKQLLSTKQRWSGPIVTQIVPAGVFYPAEDYHQDYFRKNPESYHEYRVGCGRDARLKELWGMPGRSAS
jgi:peptide-methionine (S)-S-oxide reductase